MTVRHAAPTAGLGAAPAGALVDGQGAPVALGAVLGQGGEGAVYEVAGASDVVAKVYHAPASPERARKLRVMAAACAPSLTSVAAWPSATLHPAPRGPTPGRASGGMPGSGAGPPTEGVPVVGLLMPKVTGHLELHHLYSPSQRRADFPGADWRFLVAAARNVAAAVAAVHQAGHVVGDVNQKNVVVSPQATVRLLDCDSFQVRDGDAWHRCEVGVAEFTPPELQGRTFRDVVRTPQHDAFGLAVLVFHLLFMGRHPFVGVSAGPPLQIDESIQAFQFAFGAEAPRQGLRPPPAALPLAAAGTPVAALFERAFSARSAHEGTRPTAAEWAGALHALAAEVKACAAFRGHTYHASLGACPWCAIETRGGPNFFVTTLIVRPGAPFNLGLLWVELVGLTPPAAPALPTPPSGYAAVGAVAVGPAAVAARASRVGFSTGLGAVQVTEPQAAAGRAFRQATGGAAGHTAGAAQPVGDPVPRRVRLVTHAYRGGLALLAVILFAGVPAAGLPWILGAVLGVAVLVVGADHVPLAAERNSTASDAALGAALAAYERARGEASRDLARCRADFEEALRGLETLRQRYLRLPDDERRALARLEAERQADQLRRHLERFPLRPAKIDGIGPGRVAALLSFGIENAADVSDASVQRVPGFGPGLASRLLGWRQGCAASFRFDPTRAVDPAAVRRVQQETARARQEVETALATGAHELRRRRGRYDERHAAALRDLAHAAGDLERRRTEAERIALDAARAKASAALA